MQIDRQTPAIMSAVIVIAVWRVRLILRCSVAISVQMVRALSTAVFDGLEGS
jgi:hypothetical protein